MCTLNQRSSPKLLVGDFVKQSSSTTNKKDDKRQVKAVQTVLRNGLGHMRLPFAYKLHILLEDMEKTGCEHIISWVEDGKAFKIHKPKEFEKQIQPRYFRQSKYASFVRQCYIYGFAKVEYGPCQGSYIHPDFSRSNQAKALTIERHSLGERRRKQDHNVTTRNARVSLDDSISSRSAADDEDSSDDPQEDEGPNMIFSEIRPLQRHRHEETLRRMDEAIEFCVRGEPKKGHHQQVIEFVPMNIASSAGTMNVIVSREPSPQPWTALGLPVSSLDPWLAQFDIDPACLEPRPIELMVNSRRDSVSLSRDNFCW